MALDFDALKDFFSSFPKVVNEIDTDAHSKIGQIVTTAAEDLFSLLPVGPEVDEIVVALKEAATLAHGLLQRHEVEHAGEDFVTATDAHTLLPDTVPAKPVVPVAPESPAEPVQEPEASLAPAASSDAAPTEVTATAPAEAPTETAPTDSAPEAPSPSEPSESSSEASPGA